MGNTLSHFIRSNAGNLHIFLSGAVTAVILILLLCLLLLILRLLFHNASKIRGLNLTTDHGSVYISANAVFDLIRSMDRDFPCFRIHKIRLLTDKEKNLVLHVCADYTKTGNSLLTAADDFQSSALLLLKDTFGIENIASVELIISHGKI